MLWWVHLHIFEAKLEGEELSPFVIESVGLVGFAIPWAVLRISKPRIPDSTSKIVADSTFSMQKITGFRNPNSLTWGETRQKLNSKKLAHFSQVNHFHPGYFKYKKNIVLLFSEGSREKRVVASSNHLISLVSIMTNSYFWRTSLQDATYAYRKGY